MRSTFVAESAAIAAAGSFFLVLPRFPAPVSAATDVLRYNRLGKGSGLPDTVHVPRNLAEGEVDGVFIAEEHSSDSSFQYEDGRQRRREPHTTKRRSFSGLVHSRLSGRTSTKRPGITVPKLLALKALLAVALLVVGQLRSIVLECLTVVRALRQPSAGLEPRSLSESEGEGDDQTARNLCSALRVDSALEEGEQVAIPLVNSHTQEEETVDNDPEETAATGKDGHLSRRDQIIERVLLSWSGIVLGTALIAAVVALILYDPKDSDGIPPYNSTASAPINGSGNISSPYSSSTGSSTVNSRSSVETTTTDSSSLSGSIQPSSVPTTLTSAPSATASASSAAHSPSGGSTAHSPSPEVSATVSSNQTASSTVMLEAHDKSGTTPSTSSGDTGSPHTTFEQAASSESQSSNATSAVTSPSSSVTDSSAFPSSPAGDASPPSSSPGSARTSPSGSGVPTPFSGQTITFSESTAAPSVETPSPTPLVDTSSSTSSAPNPKGKKYILEGVYVNCTFKGPNMKICYATTSPFSLWCYYPFTRQPLGDAIFQLRIPGWQRDRLKKHNKYEALLKEFVEQIVTERWKRYTRGEQFNLFYMTVESDINPYELE